MLRSDFSGMRFAQPNLTMRKQIESKEEEKFNKLDDIKEMIHENINKTSKEEEETLKFDLDLDSAVRVQLNQNLAALRKNNPSLENSRQLIDENINRAQDTFTESSTSLPKDELHIPNNTKIDSIKDIEAVKPPVTTKTNSVNKTSTTEFQAKNTVVTSLESEVNSTYQLLFNENLSLSGLSNDEIKEQLSEKFSESPLAKLAYVKQEQSNLLITANNNELTAQDYYNSAKDTLMAIFPDSNLMSDSMKSSYESKIQTLSLNEILEFQNKALELPAQNSDNYDTALKNFTEEFLAKTNGKPEFSVSNPNESMTFNQVFEQTYGVEYNEEKINNLNVAQTTYSVLQQTEIGRKTIHANLDNATTTTKLEEGILKNVKMYSLSYSDEDMSTALQKLTNMSNVSVVDGKIQGNLSEIKTNMLETVDSRALELYSSVSTNTTSQSSGRGEPIAVLYSGTTNSSIPSVTTTGSMNIDKSSMVRSRGAVSSAPTTSTSTSAKADEAFANITSSLESSYRDAYGDKTAEQLSTVANSDMTWVDWTRKGIEGLGLAISVGSAFVPGAGLAGMALGGAITSFAGAGFEIATEVVDGLIDGDIDTDRIKELYSEMGTNGLLFGLGLGIGGVASGLGNVAKSVTSSALGKYVSSISESLSNGISNAASFLVDKGSDFFMSIMGNSVITGDMNVTGELIAQVVGTVIPGIKNSELGQSTLAKLGLGAGDFSGAITSAKSAALIGESGQNWIEKNVKKHADAVTETINRMCEKALSGEQPNRDMFKELKKDIMKEYKIRDSMEQYDYEEAVGKALKFSGLTDLASCYKTKAALVNDDDYQEALNDALDTLNDRIETYAKTVQTEQTAPGEKQPDTTPSTKDDSVVDGETTVQNKSEVEENAKTETETNDRWNEPYDEARLKELLEKYPELDDYAGYSNADLVRAGELLENYAKKAADGDYSDFDETKLWKAIHENGLNVDLRASEKLFNELKSKYYPEVKEWEQHVTNMKNKYKFNSPESVKEADDLINKLKQQYKDGITPEDITKAVDNAKLTNKNWDSEKIEQYIKDDPDIQNLLNKQSPNNQTVGIKDNGLNGQQVQDVTNSLRNPINKNYLNGLNNDLNQGDNSGFNNAGFDNDPFGTNNNDYSNNNNYNDDRNNEIPSQTPTLPTPEIKEPELPKAPDLNTNPDIKGIETTTNSYEFTGNINEQFGNQPQVGEINKDLNTQTPQEKLNQAVKAAEDAAIQEAREKYGRDAVISTDKKIIVDENGNFQVKIDVTIKGVGVNSQSDDNGNLAGDNNQAGKGTNTTNATGQGQGAGQGNSNGNGTGNGVGNGAGDRVLPNDSKLTDLANKPNHGNTKLPTNDNTWQGSFGQSIIYNYGNGDGTIDTDRLTNDWVNAGGTAYTYTGSGAQEAFNALQNGTWDSHTNYGTNNTGYTNDWSWTGFDVFSVGGNPYGGGIVYNEYGQIDYRNSWFSLGSGGGGDALLDYDGNQYANHMDRIQKCNVMVQDCR